MLWEISFSVSICAVVHENSLYGRGTASLHRDDVAQIRGHQVRLIGESSVLTLIDRGGAQSELLPTRSITQYVTSWCRSSPASSMIEAGTWTFMGWPTSLSVRTGRSIRTSPQRNVISSYASMLR